MGWIVKRLFEEGGKRPVKFMLAKGSFEHRQAAAAAGAGLQKIIPQGEDRYLLL